MKLSAWKAAFYLSIAWVPAVEAACKDVCKAPRVCSGKPPNENCLVPFRLTPNKEIELLAPARPDELPFIAEMARRGESNVQ